MRDTDHVQGSTNKSDDMRRIKFVHHLDFVFHHRIGRLDLDSNILRKKERKMGKLKGKKKQKTKQKTVCVCGVCEERGRCLPTLVG